LAWSGGEDGPGVGQLELSQLAAVGAGEGAPLVPEQLRLEELPRQRGAVDLDPRAIGPRGRRVDGSGDQLLADTALAEDQDGSIGEGDLSHHVAQAPHLGAGFEELGIFEGVTAVEDVDWRVHFLGREVQRWYHRTKVRIGGENAEEALGKSGRLARN
jgi:hypothetical protein